MESIQKRLDDATRAQAESDYKEAVNKVHALMAPFYAQLQYTDYRSEETIAAGNAAVKGLLHINQYGRLYIGDDAFKVPETYISYKQQKASAEFIEKVEKLQEQIDELYNTVGN